MSVDETGPKTSAVTEAPVERAVRGSPAAVLPILSRPGVDPADVEELLRAIVSGRKAPRLPDSVE